MIMGILLASNCNHLHSWGDQKSYEEKMEKRPIQTAEIYHVEETHTIESKGKCLVVTGKTLKNK